MLQAYAQRPIRCLRFNDRHKGKLVVFLLSGRIKAAAVAELQKLLEAEARDHSVALDLNEVKRVDHDVVSFVANCEAKSIKLANCPAYIRDGFPVQGGQYREALIPQRNTVDVASKPERNYSCDHRGVW